MNRIKELRQKRGMQQKDLGALLNCTRVAISHYETGERDLSSETINRLCDIFECTADYLLCRSAVPGPELAPEEEQLLLSWRSAPPEIRAIIDTALAPYRQEGSSSATA